MPAYPDPQVVASAARFKRALIDGMRAWPGLDGVQVTWGVGRREKQSEWVMVGRIRRREQFAALGGNRREEVMAVTVRVTVTRSNIDGVEAAETRAWEIEGEIARMLRQGVGDPTVGGTVRVAELSSDDTDAAGDALRRNQGAGEIGEQAVACLELVITTQTRI